MGISFHLQLPWLPVRPRVNRSSSLAFTLTLPLTPLLLPAPAPSTFSSSRSLSRPLLPTQQCQPQLSAPLSTRLSAPALLQVPRRLTVAPPCMHPAHCKGNSHGNRDSLTCCFVVLKKTATQGALFREQRYRTSALGR